jgi:omega-amidase
VARLNIALGQMQIALGEPRKNYERVEQWTTEAARRGAHIVVFPELWSTGYALERGHELAHGLNEGLFAEVGTLAATQKISIVGSMLEKRGNDITNSAAFVSPGGRVLGVYRKIHLFRLMSEDRWLQAGASPLAMDLPWGRTALAICYDLRFPELFRRYSTEGAKLIIIPAEWPLVRVEHWRVLLQARAIENQCYIVAVNACGQTGDTVFGGHSMVVDPWGKIVVEAGETPALLNVDIEMDAVEDIRQRIPVFEDRRPEVY